MKKLLLLLSMVILSQGSFAKDTVSNITLTVTENGFEPAEIKVKTGTHVVLKVTRKTDVTCATQIVLKSKGINKELPLNKEVSVDLGVLKKGEIGFACSMDMISGHIIAE